MTTIRADSGPPERRMNSLRTSISPSRSSPPPMMTSLPWGDWLLLMAVAVPRVPVGSYRSVEQRSHRRRHVPPDLGGHVDGATGLADRLDEPVPAQPRQGVGEGGPRDALEVIA